MKKAICIVAAAFTAAVFILRCARPRGRREAQ